MNRSIIITIAILSAVLNNGCKSQTNQQPVIQDLKGTHVADTSQTWLTHEHVLVDFIGADSIQPDSWNHDSITQEVLPFFNELSKYNVDYFVDATPAYLGRDVSLLEKISDKTGIKILTNTGFYGARNSKYIPNFAKAMTAEEISEIWINEFIHGIDDTDIKPGFIKIGVDNTDPLKTMHQKLVEAATLTHLKTGLTIASHTGEAKGMWPQIKILQQMGVSPEAFIWVHAQVEKDVANYLKAAEVGCWISLDGLGWEIDEHVEKLVFAKKNRILDRILISHDAGWYDPQKDTQSIKPYTDIFEKLIPKLKSNGFTDQEINQLLKVNPVKAFSLEIKKAAPKND
ncbi:MAG: phosphotriesterase [Cyclobacteriaceae bacterium]